MAHPGVATLGPDKRLSPKSFGLWCGNAALSAAVATPAATAQEGSWRVSKSNQGQRVKEAELMEMTKGCERITRMEKIESVNSSR